MNQLKILCHAGPWSDSYLKCVLSGVDKDANVVILSAHKAVDKSGAAFRYYDFLRLNKKSTYALNARDSDIIQRCRLLRALPLNVALLHLNSMRDALREVYDREQPHFVFSETIDAYVMDLMKFECEDRGIPFVGLVSVFVNGYVRVSARGEFNRVREPSVAEVKKVLEMLEAQSYKPSFVSQANRTKAVFRRWFRNLLKIPYFSIKRIVSGERYNYHYWQNLFVSRDWLHIWPRLNVGDNNWKQELGGIEKPIIYVPLQMIPEATVDYWCESLDVIDYDNVLLKFIDFHKDKFHFLIKEHPNVLGFRNPRLYKKLQQRENVTLCPTDINSNEILDIYSAVLVWTGTVGFEAALRSKPVIMLATPYYYNGSDRFKVIDLRTSADEIEQYLANFKAITHEQKYSLVKYILSGVVAGKFQVDGSWSESNNKEVEEANLLGSHLKDYLKQLLQEKL